MIPFGSFKIGRILGIDLEINYTWFLVFALVTGSFSLVFRQELSSLSLFISIILAVFTAALFFVSVLLHELSHSYVAKRNSLEIKKITLFIFGGVAQMTEEPSSPQVEFKMAIAGPSMSLFLSLLFLSVWLFGTLMNFGPVLPAPFALLAEINLGLAVFNLLPGFPLDGGRVARAALWYFLKDLRKATRIASYAGRGIAFLLIFAGFAGFVSDLNFGGLWLVLIGGFLNNAARQSYKQLEMQQVLSKVKVGEMMVKGDLSVHPDAPIDLVAGGYDRSYRLESLPVVEDGRLLGIIRVRDIKEVPRANWPVTTARQLTKPANEEIVISPDEDAFKALIKMAQANVRHLLVMEDGQLRGVISKSDVLRSAKNSLQEFPSV